MEKNELKDKQKELFAKAVMAAEYAYAPYSGFSVGAALLCSDGSVYTGCNIENAAYPSGICAERTAVFKAVSEGERSFTAIAIAGGKNLHDRNTQPCFPCGACRQVLSEFCGSDFRIILSDRVVTLGEILPLSFGVT